MLVVYTLSRHVRRGKADVVHGQLDAKRSAGIVPICDTQAVRHKLVSEPAFDVLEAGGTPVLCLPPTVECPRVVAAVKSETSLVFRIAIPPALPNSLF